MILGAAPDRHWTNVSIGLLIFVPARPTVTSRGLQLNTRFKTEHDDRSPAPHRSRMSDNLQIGTEGHPGTGMKSVIGLCNILCAFRARWQIRGTLSVKSAAQVCACESEPDHVFGLPRKQTLVEKACCNLLVDLGRTSIGLREIEED